MHEPTTQPCPDCHGNGQPHGNDAIHFTCETCHNTGVVLTTVERPKELLSSR
jgi:DnaJ-class molecular chaperone